MEERKNLTDEDVIEYAKSKALRMAKFGLTRDIYLTQMNKLFSAYTIKAADIALANTISDEVVDKCIDMQEFCYENKVQIPVEKLKEVIGEENYNKLIILGTITIENYTNYIWWDSKADMNIGKIKYFRDKEKDRMKK